MHVSLAGHCEDFVIVFEQIGWLFRFLRGQLWKRGDQLKCDSNNIGEK